MRVPMNKVKCFGTIGLSAAIGVSSLLILVAVSNISSTRANATKPSPASTRKLTSATPKARAPIQGPACITPPPDMVSWWPGDGNATDIQDGNNGTLVGGTTFAAGKVGQSFSLDGIDDFINVPDADNLDITSQITIDAWINPTALGGRIVDKMTPGEPDGYLLDTFGGKVRFVFGGQEVSGATTLPTGTFTHVAATYDFTTLRVYVNGVEDGMLPAEEISAAPNNLPFRIGSDQTGANRFSGLIDEVEIFNRALAESEIFSIVSADSAGKCKNICVLTCPSDISQANDINQCGAVISFAPTSSVCGTVTCAPPSNSFFPKGTTVVTCTAAGGTMCSFNVTITDTEPPTMMCPDLTRSTDPGQCMAVVNYPPVATDNCPNVSVVCTPPSGSTFPLGPTMVNCTATDTSGNMDQCSFTVTVVDTQPPTITCSPNIVAPAPPTGACTVAASAPASFSVTASDNCSTPTTVCKNQNGQVVTSGQAFPVGTTTVVTCTATDASGNTASCSFSIFFFSGCVQDDSDASKVVLFNAQTGQYRFCCGGTVYTGTGAVTVRGCLVTIQHNASDRRVQISTDGNTGNASVQSPPGTTRCTIQDRNVRNNSCVCQ